MRLLRFPLFAPALAALILLLGLLGATVSAQSPVTVKIDQETNSGISGTATLTAMGNQTQVVVDLQGAGAGPQPAHIHEGQCGPTLNPKPQFPLTSVQNGKATTTVDVSLSSLLTGKFAINVHKSPQEASVYVACGNIPAATSTVSALPRTGDNGLAIAIGSAVLAIVVLAGGLALRRRSA